MKILKYIGQGIGIVLILVTTFVIGVMYGWGGEETKDCPEQKNEALISDLARIIGEFPKDAKTIRTTWHVIDTANGSLVKNANMKPLEALGFAIEFDLPYKKKGSYIIVTVHPGDSIQEITTWVYKKNTKVQN